MSQPLSNIISLSAHPIALFISGAALVISFLTMIYDWPLAVDPAWFTVLISGVPILLKALESLFLQFKIRSALLISIAIIACIVTDELFAAGEVAFIMALGELLEDLSVNRSRKGLNNLLKLTPTMANVIADDGEQTYSVAANTLKKGDRVRVLSGERIPVDGRVIKGKTSVDEALLTGESLPISKEEGQDVYCGTINKIGSIDVEVIREAANTKMAQMLRLIREAEEHKAPTERVVDRWASIMVPVALLLALIIGWVTDDITRGVTVLVVFCPCAMVLATPVSVVAGIGQATKRGVVIKSGEALECMSQVRSIVFDKTGTLTKGSLYVEAVESFFPDEWKDTEILQLAAALEQRSEHPLAKAIVSRAKNMTSTYKVEDFEYTVSNGVYGKVDGMQVRCGTITWMENFGIRLNESEENIVTRYRTDGCAVVFVAVHEKCIGLIALADDLRPESRRVIHNLHTQNVHLYMLTGDHKLSAFSIAQRLGINNVRSELQPEQKVKIITRMQADGDKVCMVGDGIHDIPALKTATVSVAIGGIGNDLAMENADIVLMQNGVGSLAYLRRLSLAVVKNIKVNITISMIINVVAIILSALAILGPVSGALVHNIGSVFVVLNAARLYDKKV